MVSYHGSKSVEQIANELGRTNNFVEAIVQKHQKEVTPVKEVAIPPTTDKRGITVMTEGASQAADKQAKQTPKGTMFKDAFIFKPKG